MKREEKKMIMILTRREGLKTRQYTRRREVMNANTLYTANIVLHLPLIVGCSLLTAIKAELVRLNDRSTPAEIMSLR